MIHFLSALRCEAQPLIEHYGMSSVGSGCIFDCYIDKHHDVSLTISGPGKTAAASAVIHTHMLLSPGNGDCWINLGIAGHDTLDVGSPVVVNKVLDYATGRTWYPQFLFQNNLISRDLITLDGPSDIYHESAMYDMEAAGFYDAVSRISTLERCHSLKVISDNRSSNIDTISKTRVRNLIHARIEQIIGFTTGLASIAPAQEALTDEDPEFRQILGQYHFSHSQKLLLRKLLQRWRVLSPDTMLDITERVRPKNSRELLACLKKRLDTRAFHF